MGEAVFFKAKALRVFVVEDHRDTLTYLLMYLESLGYMVGSARSVAEAHATLSKEDYDVLISDIGLPDSNGWDLLHRVRTGGRQPFYAVAMSGFALRADHVRSQEAGFRHHLLKPLDLKKLDAALAEAARELAGPTL